MVARNVPRRAAYGVGLVCSIATQKIANSVRLKTGFRISAAEGGARLNAWPAAFVDLRQT